MFTETDRFEALPNGGTRMHVLIQLNIPLPHFARRLMARRILLGTHHYDRMLLDAAKRAGEQYETTAGVE